MLARRDLGHRDHRRGRGDDRRLGARVVIRLLRADAVHEHVVHRVGEIRVDVGAAAAHQRGVGGEHQLVVLGGDDVLGDDDVAAERLPERVQVHITGQLVADLDRPVELQDLVGLHDLAQVVAGDDRLEQLALGQDPDQGDEGERSHQAVVAVLLGDVLVPVHRVVVLDGAGVLADLLAADLVVVVDAVVVADHRRRVRRGVELRLARLDGFVCAGVHCHGRTVPI
ncbi:Uncharacterised protein [Mycobacteroides abscessus subsp. abscessus]|nr:Uncharacterised protein [Mycobacteroides abscessus subsp. abscessus]